MKDFRGWGDYQVKLEGRAYPTRPFAEGQVWRCALGHNVGSEMDGKSRRYWRPVLIIRKFHEGFFVGVPLTSSAKGRPHHVSVTVKGKAGYAVVSQLRAMDARRLQQYLAKLEPDEWVRVLDGVRSLFSEI